MADSDLDTADLIRRVRELAARDPDAVREVQTVLARVRETLAASRTPSVAPLPVEPDIDGQLGADAGPSCQVRFA